MSRKKKRYRYSYTKEEAEARIPSVLRNMALLSIDTLIALDRLQVNSRGIEARIMSLQGYASHLFKLCALVWRVPKEERDDTE